jgi:hypothetical protein
VPVAEPPPVAPLPVAPLPVAPLPEPDIEPPLLPAPVRLPRISTRLFTYFCKSAVFPPIKV